MPANLVITDKDGQEIDIYQGLDFGLTRKGLPNFQEIKIRNTGNVAAKDVVLTAIPMSAVGEVTEEEYENQMKATQWKSFGYEQNGLFSQYLSIGDIKANSSLEGTKTTSVEFDSHFSGTHFTSGEITRTPNSLTLSQFANEVKDGTSCRITSDTFKACRDVEISFNLEFEARNGEGKQDTLVVFPVRMNSKNNKMGYLMVVKYIPTSKRFSVSIWKDAKGIESHYDRDYGTKIFESEQTPVLDSNKKITLKIYNDKQIRPSFEFLYDGKPMLLGKPGVESSLAYVVKDTTTSAYVNDGALYMDFSISSAEQSVTVKNMDIKTENPNQSIFVRTLIDDRAEDMTWYSSAISISYIEE